MNFFTVYQATVQKAWPLIFPDEVTWLMTLIIEPPYATNDAWVQFTFSSFSSLDAFLQTCSGSTLHWAPVSGWKRMKLPDSSFSVTSCESSSFTAATSICYTSPASSSSKSVFLTSFSLHHVRSGSAFHIPGIPVQWLDKIPIFPGVDIHIFHTLCHATPDLAVVFY